MIQKKKQIKQDNETLTERNTFLKAFFYWQRKNFLNGNKYNLSSVKAHNFAHVLSKGNFKWFKYYFKNIVILTLDQHVLFDNYTEEKFQTRLQEHTEEKWGELFDYMDELKKEYYDWIKENPKTYKLD